MNFIYLVWGKQRLDEPYKTVKYVIDGKTFETSLVSLAYARYLIQRGEKVKITFFFPASLSDLIQLFTNYAESKNEINIAELEQELRKIFIDLIKDVLEGHSWGLSENDISVKIVPPINYVSRLSQERIVKISANYNSVFLCILSSVLNDLLILSKGENQNRFIADMNQGFNIIVSAMREVVRTSAVISNLYFWGVDGKNQFQILFSDPILGDIKESFSVYIEDINVEKSFYMPFDFRKLNTIKNESLIWEIFGDDEILKNAILCFYSIYYNLPLLAISYKFQSHKEINEQIEKAVKNLEGIIKRVRIEKSKISGESKLTISFESPKSEQREHIVNLLISLVLYSSIVKELERYNLKQKQDGISLDELKKFSKIYRHFNLVVNKEILETELDRIKGNKGIASEWKKLSEIDLKPAELKPIDKEINLRNLIAHSGFEKNITLVKKREKETRAVKLIAHSGFEKSIILVKKREKETPAVKKDEDILVKYDTEAVGKIVNLLQRKIELT